MGATVIMANPIYLQLYTLRDDAAAKPSSMPGASKSSVHTQATQTFSPMCQQQSSFAGLLRQHA